MPIYEYECTTCDKIFEVKQRISDKPLQTCPECQNRVKKIMSVNSFQLKGGGWYADGYASTGGSSHSSSSCSSASSCNSSKTCPAAAAASS